MGRVHRLFQSVLSHSGWGGRAHRGGWARGLTGMRLVRDTSVDHSRARGREPSVQRSAQCDTTLSSYLSARRGASSTHVTAAPTGETTTPKDMTQATSGKHTGRQTRRRHKWAHPPPWASSPGRLRASPMSAGCPCGDTGTAACPPQPRWESLVPI